MSDDTPIRTAVDDLLDRFVETVTPNHHQSLAAPSVAIEVRKSDLRDAAKALLEQYANYLEASRSTRSSASDAGSSDPDDAEPPSPSHRSKKK